MSDQEATSPQSFESFNTEREQISYKAGDSRQNNDVLKIAVLVKTDELSTIVWRYMSDDGVGTK